MLPNNSHEISSGNYISVPATGDIPTPQAIQPTTYDYLVLIPAIVTALTPLILGLKNKDKDDEDKE
ncbi:hypothetical protein IQ247_25390 [Plectonema cf. radiosum LEGE 06105]|uniref:Uncharacterized protein n=2 Tax=Plectonema TaxID=1183 RepID=A0A8J7JVL5_9CYAN|nr:hypothetical protein [Plectonema cf. radiosum LEGE 06105]